MRYQDFESEDSEVVSNMFLIHKFQQEKLQDEAKRNRHKSNRKR